MVEIDPAIEARLARLKRLYDLGLISETIYEERVRAILDKL